MFVEAADGGIAEEDTATTVGLQPVLVRVDDDGVGVRDGVEGGARFGGEVCGEGEVATVGGIDVNAELIFFLKGNDAVEWVDGADCSCT